MTITDSIRRILLALSEFYVLTRAQIQLLCAQPGTDRAGRKMREKLTLMRREGLLNQAHGLVVFPDRNGAPAPVYYPSRKGCELLAVEMKDDRFLTVCTRTPDWQHLHHWIRVSDFHILLRNALAKQSEVGCDGWLNEWDVANPNEKDPAKRFKLFTEITKEPRLVAAADAGMLMSYRGFKKVFLLEIDRGTSGVQQIARSKTPGYAAMAKEQLHRRFFANEDVWKEFSVLLVTTTENRMDALRRAIHGRPGSELWRFSTWKHLENDPLFGPALFTCEGGPVPWFKRV